MNRASVFDTSSELCIYRSGDGIKLIRPDEMNGQIHSQQHYFTGHTVGSVLKLASNIFFIDRSNIYRIVNDSQAAMLGFSSVNATIGKTILNSAKREIGESIIKHNIATMRSSRTTILDTHLIKQNNTYAHIMMIKAPLYNNDNQIVGLFSCGLTVGMHNLADTLNDAAQLGLLTHFESRPYRKSYTTCMDDIQLSRRETEVLNFVVRGLSARRIAEVLSVSKTYY